jgi:hypothetical protein
MKPRHSLIAVLFLAASCDKAKEIAGQATSAVKERISEKVGAGTAPQIDPELQKLVDQTEEGVVFRKDLPFPTRLDVRVTRSQQWSGRIFRQSAIERTSESLEGTRLTTDTFQRDGDQVRHTIEETGFSLPATGDADEVKQTLADPFKTTTAERKSYTYLKQGGSWRADRADGFRAASLAKDLAPEFENLLVDHALAARPLWFSSKKRFKTGDRLTVTGRSLPMLVAGKATGSLELILESIDAVDGHPCAVFSVTGDYSRRQFPDFQGTFTDEDVTIQSGKLWLSLIHPLILREELDTIQTVKSGSKGEQNIRGQGAIKVAVTRSWKARE